MYFMLSDCKDTKKIRFPPRENRNFYSMNIDFNISRVRVLIKVHESALMLI